MNKKNYQLNDQELATLHSTNLETGLSLEEVQLRIERDGLNKLNEGKKRSLFKRFLDQLAVAHPNAKILVTRSPHTGSGYVYKLGNKDINPRCNRYSQYVKDYCDSRDNFYYVDVTSCLEDGNGWLRPEYADSSTYHLTSSGYTTWFNAIETVILEYLNM